MAFHIISADNTGITVSNLERSLAFWRDVLGFDGRAHALGGELDDVGEVDLKDSRGSSR